MSLDGLTKAVQTLVDLHIYRRCQFCHYRLATTKATGSSWGQYDETPYAPASVLQAYARLYGSHAECEAKARAHEEKEKRFREQHMHIPEGDRHHLYAAWWGGDWETYEKAYTHLVGKPPPPEYKNTFLRADP